MITLIKYADIQSMLGNPEDIDRHDMVIIPSPFPLKLSWQKETSINKILIHPHIAAGLEAALDEILDYYGLDFIQENSLDEWGGSYNARKSRGSDRWSVHSWAMAVDYLPSLGRFGVPATTPYKVVAAFKRQGFLWGGDWANPDGMHFTGIIE